MFHSRAESLCSIETADVNCLGWIEETQRGVAAGEQSDIPVRARETARREIGGPSPARLRGAGRAQRIECGMTGHKHATLARVAELAGVSIGCASRVLNHDPTVKLREDTRIRIIAVAEKLDYVPNVSARALRRSQTGVLGLAVHNLAAGVIPGVFGGAREAAAANGKLLLLADADEIVRDTSARDLLVAGRRIDGLLLQTGHANFEAAIIDEIASRVPTVLMGTPGTAAAPGVRIAEDQAGEEAARHLLELGHRQIAYIGGAKGSYTDRIRLKGIQNAVSTVPDATLRCTWAGSWGAPDGYKAFRRVAQWRRRPTGVVTVNALVATGAIRAAFDANVAIPRQISLVSIQDSWTVQFTTPRITTVPLPQGGLGRHAVERLLKYLKHRDDASDVIIPIQGPHLCVRESDAACMPPT